MKGIRNHIILALLFAISFTSSLALVLQTYEYRNSFSALEKMLKNNFEYILIDRALKVKM